MPRARWTLLDVAALALTMQAVVFTLHTLGAI